MSNTANNTIQPYSLISPCGYQSSHCGYCDTDDTSRSYGVISSKMSVQDYEKLMLRGWRRSGKYFYKPTLHLTCCPQYTIRLKASKFNITNKQKQLVRRFDRYLLTGDVHVVSNADSSAVNADNSDNNTLYDTENTNRIHIESTTNKSNVKHQKTQNKRATKFSSQNATPTNTNVTNKFNFTIETVPAESTPERFKLYKRYQVAVHNDTESDITEKKFREFLVESPLHNVEASSSAICKEPLYGPVDLQSLTPKPCTTTSTSTTMTLSLPCVAMNVEPAAERESASTSSSSLHTSTTNMEAAHADISTFSTTAATSDAAINSLAESTRHHRHYGTYHQLYRLNDVLVAVGVIDLLPSGLSAVYLFYDPEHRDLVLGKYTALCELQYCIKNNYEYYYMGFYIHNCEKMKYKSDFHPSELLCPTTWTFYDFQTVCEPILNKFTFSPFQPDMAKERQDVENRILQLKSTLLTAAAATAAADDDTHTKTTTSTATNIDTDEGAKLPTNVTAAASSAKSAVTATTASSASGTTTAADETKSTPDKVVSAATVAASSVTSLASSTNNNTAVRAQQKKAAEIVAKLTLDMLEPFHPPSYHTAQSFDLNNIRLDIKSPSGKLVTLSQLKSSSQSWVASVLRDWTMACGSDIAQDFIVKFN